MQQQVVGRSERARPVVVPLQDASRYDVALVGGKGAGLGELVRQGWRVPAGFVVTTAAYVEAVAAAGVPVAERVAADDLAGLRAEIAAAPLSAEVRREIVTACAALGDGPVAVRSSATAEDLPGAAFAGQQDTHLGVVGDDAVVDAVRRCWASLWTDRAVAYRRRLRMAPEEVRIAVVVQRMVDAEVAGVLLTADPVTGDRHRLVVEASSGLGEAVVSGLVTPDHYELDRRGRVRVSTAGRREVVVRSAPGGGTVTDAGDPGGVARLSRAVLAELARTGTAVAERAGRPQDMEWALADGRLWWLQARPMTALPPPPVRLNRLQRQVSQLVVEYFSVRPYPIDATTWVPHGVVGAMGRVTRSVGVTGVFEHLLHEQDGVVDRLLLPTPRPTPAVLLAPARIARRARRFDPARWTADPRLLDATARSRAMAADDLRVLPWRDLLARPREALALVPPLADLRIDYLPGTGLALLRLVLVLALLRRRAAMTDLLAGIPTRTDEANRALEALADRVRADPALDAALADAIARPGAGPDDGAALPPDFAEQVAAFLVEFGHRETATPVLVTPPTLADDPAALLGTVRVLASSPRRSDDRADRARRAMGDLLAARPLRSPAVRDRARRWVAAARAGMAFREDSHAALTLPLPALRRSLLEIGRRLQVAGVLEQPEDVFHLRLAELEALGGLEDAGQVDDADRDRLCGLVRARAARREELSGVPLIDTAAVYRRRRSHRRVEEDGGEVVVTGTPAGRGRATGPVTVVHGPAEFGRLSSGDVLVCPSTNPAWTPLFGRAAAVVVDTGGPASHAAIVAREHGIPAVMGTVTGSTALPDGQVVTVDGGTGRVTLARRSAQVPVSERP
ncbi:PEP/pyruvate-binding domain-containing protein [Geodermatophilus sp. TF02-6]|uniref:PEP/pyruvate-binding domain-containing protein n=1 Tax=Geodermatophilus sp. TF02-6 TaxID=2250575 RepID=UPI0018F509CE|nr:PEP/pyruvate-binding domain-containing protein [Geodermatophilus sp. TF02-6]